MVETAGLQLLLLDYLGKKGQNDLPTIDRSMTLPEFTRLLKSVWGKRLTTLLYIYIYRIPHEEYYLFSQLGA